MGCACKVNQQLDYLHKKYGKEIPVSKATHISFHIKEFVRSIPVYIAMLLCIPFFFLGTILHILFGKGKPIRIDKVFRIKKI